MWLACPKQLCVGAIDTKKERCSDPYSLNRMKMKPTTVSFAIVTLLRWFLLPMFLIAFWRGAYAGADPTPTDWLPQFNKVRFEGQDVIFDAGVTQIRLRDGKWSNASGLPINTMVEKQNLFSPRNTECSVPQEVLSRYKNEYKPTEVMYCELPGRIWFATGGYCGEGDDDPGYNQGRLYSFMPMSGEVREYPGFLPKCAELAGLERIGNQLILVTVYQEEYSLGSGQVLIYDLDHVKAPPKVLTNPHPSGAVIGMSSYDKQCDCLWFATLEGIERLTVGNGKWERRYLDYEISPDNKFLPTVSPIKPSAEKMWLGRVLYRYPIEDVRGFVSAWNHSPASEYDNPRIGPLMLPFYISAIERTNEGWSDWHFAELMNDIAAHKDNESQVMIRAQIEKLLKQPMNLSRRKEVISSAKKFGIADARKLEDEYFDSLMNDYFIRPRSSSSYGSDAVRISFEQPEYLPKLRDYYLTHTITFDVEDAFLDRVKQYSSWPGYEIMATAVEQGRNRYEYRQGLLRKCGALRSSREVDPTRAKNELITILQARLETDTQAIFMNDLNLNGTGSCIDASRYWIYGRDKAQFRARTDLMVDVAETNKKFVQNILEILNFRYSTNYNNLEEWKKWWSISKSADVNNRPETALQPATKESAVVTVANPFSVKQYHVSYDVKADGTCMELHEIVMNVDTEDGVLLAKHFPIGTPSRIFRIGKRDLDVLTVYTLKKNGQHIDAIRLSPQKEKLPSSAEIKPMQAIAKETMVSFQDLAVGDNLIFSYKVIQNEASSRDSFALTQTFPKTIAYDIVVINLSAPTALNLRIEADGIEAGKVTDIDGIRNWVWKYQSKKTEVLHAGEPVPFEAWPMLNISNFKDQAAERAALGQ